MYDELIKALRNVSEYDSGYAKLMYDAADAIEELSKPRWIPVTERLPDEDETVFLCYEWTGRSGTVYREVGVTSLEEHDNATTGHFRPIYWMPLPEPPKEE